MLKHLILSCFITCALCCLWSNSTGQVFDLPPDSTVNRTLSPAGKVDTFRVVCTADGQLNFTLTSTNNIYTWIILYDKDTATQIKSLYTDGTATLSADGLAAGTYFVRVHTYHGDQTSTYTLKYSLAAAPVANDTEPNDTKEQASTLAINSATTGHVGYYYNKKRDGADWYKVTLPEDGLLKLKLTSHNGLYAWVYLFDNDGTTQINANYTNGTLDLNTDGLAAGTYYLRINSYHGDQFEPYTLTDTLVSPSQPNDTEPNSTKAEALELPINSTVTGHVGYYYDKKRDYEDWYKITTNSDGRLQLKLSSHNGRHVWVYLFDNNGTTQINANYTDGSLVLNTDGLAAGTYYVRVNSYHADQFAPYTLTDSLIAPQQANDSEPNSTKLQALTLDPNSTVTGHVGYYYNGQRDTEDWYKITTQEDGMLKLKLSSHNNRHVWVYLFDNDGTTQLNANYTDGSLVLNTDGLSAGTYYLRVNCYHGDQFAPYTLTDSLLTYNVNDPEPNNSPYLATVIPGNATATGHTNFYYNKVRDGVDWWKINYSDSTGNLKIVFNLLPTKIDNNNRYVWFQLYKDTLAPPIHNNYFIGSSTELNFTSLTQGAYYIKLFPYHGDQFSAYSVNPQFNEAYITASISLLNATQGTGCNENSLTYKLSGSTSPYTPYTVRLFRNNVAYDSAVVGKDTAIFNFLPEGSYYATVVGFNAPVSTTATSISSQFNPVTPTPVPTGIPVITKSGRLLHATPPAARETIQWYRNDGLIVGATDTTYLAADSGSYIARYANPCGIGSASNTIYFSKAYQNQTINFPAISDTTYAPDRFIVLKASASSGLPVSYRLITGSATIVHDTIYVNGTGTITVEAIQQGDDNYGIAPAVQRSFTIQKASQTISFTSIPSKVFGDAPFSLNASSTSGLPVTFSIVSGPATVSGSTVTLTGVGSVTIKASQGGNANYNAAPDSSNTFCIGIRQISTIKGDTLVCPKVFKYYLSNKVSGAIYEWSIASGGTITSTNGDTVTINWQTPGSHTVIAKAYSGCDTIRSSASTTTVRVTDVIVPEVVTNMVPANGTPNLQLPLTLSWIPGENTSSFDLFVWDADSVQPANPYATNLFALNYTLPNTSFKYNHTYKWMIRSKNGCSQANGPVQSFSLIPLPDLVVSEVQVPASAFSGQTISIAWKVSNAGPGNTVLKQKWTDAVFLSFDTMPRFNVPPNTNPAGWSQLDFPIRPLLIGTKANVTALDSGQHYTNSINFTLPLNYSQPLYAYVITNYPGGTNSPLQTTYHNDTARAAEAISVTLSPTPDLRVDTVFTPSSVFSGSAINLTYKVKNYGVLTPSGSSWTDKFYISKSPIFNINTALQLKFKKPNESYYPNAQDATVSHSTQLLADSSYTRSAEVIIPNFIFGTWFIYVFTNSTQTLYEGPLANNNVNNSELQVTLTPTPQLTINSLAVPVSTASITQPIGVNWSIQNKGFNDNIEKNKGHYFVPIGSCEIPVHFDCPSGNCIPPRPIQGTLYKDSLSFGSSYWVDKIYLSTDASELNFSNATLVGEIQHGTQNSGLSVSDDPAATKCLPVGTVSPNINTSNVIKPGSTHPGAHNFIIPPHLPQGNYYVYVWANATKTVFEYPGTPQIKRSDLPITIQRADLVIPSVAVPANTQGGQQISLKYEIQNNGPGSVFNATRKDRIYVSSFATLNESAQLLATQTFTENIPAGSIVAHTFNYTFPQSTSGTRYFFVQTNFDSSFRENSYTNNISGPASTSVSTASPNDLVVSSIQLADTVYAIYPNYIKYSVSNNSSGTTTGTWTDSIFISCNPAFNRATSYYIGQRTQSSSVTPGSNYSDSFNVTMPFAFDINNCFPSTTNSTAYFFIKTNADQVVFEGSNGNNNVTGTGARVLINPLVDHIITSVTGPDTATVARPYNATFTVKNVGYNPEVGNYSYYSWRDAIYFSPDSVFNSKAVLATSFDENMRLSRNQSYSRAKQAVPPKLPTGDYYVFAVTNHTNAIYAERAISNNSNLIRNGAGEARKVHLVQPMLPDLVDTIINAPSSVAVGQPLTVVHTVTNTGAGVTYPDKWSNEVWLSSDFIPGNTGDIKLTANNHSGSLQPGQSRSDTITASININSVPGNYILISHVDATNNVFESNDNNNLAFKYVTIYSPSPADLIVENVTKPDTVYLGYTIDTVKWVITNNSSNGASGVSSDGIYLSKSSTLDSSAVLLSVINKSIDILPLEKDTISGSPLVTNVIEGNYNLLVKTDLLNNIVESEKNNNTGISQGSIYVKVKELMLNIPETNTLHTISRYYKLRIPDSLRGSTILVSLKTNDSATVRNEMYIGLGYVPSPSQFDQKFETANYGNQQIVMTSAVDSVYYITIRSASPNPPVQNITLKAVKLPFAILSVHSNSGGNIGNVTVKINGSLFTNNMTAKLTRPGTTITASAVYFTNSTTVYATFNLLGQPLGTYDVSLIKPDSSIATLENGFSVVEANNGGLLTGGGNNSGQKGSGNEPGCDPGAPAGYNSQLVSEVVIPEKVFAGWPFVIQVNYNNPTNFDVPAQIRILYNDQQVPVALTQAGLNENKTSLYLELTEPGGPPGIIRAGGSGTITIYAKAPVTMPGHTFVKFTLK